VYVCVCVFSLPCIGKIKMNIITFFCETTWPFKRKIANTHTHWAKKLEKNTNYDYNYKQDAVGDGILRFRCRRMANSTRRNIRVVFDLAYSFHCMKTWRHPRNRKYITHHIIVRKRTEPRSQVTCTENFVKFGRVIFEICERANKQIDIHTDTQIRWPQYFASYRGRNIWEIPDSQTFWRQYRCSYRDLNIDVRP